MVDGANYHMLLVKLEDAMSDRVGSKRREQIIRDTDKGLSCIIFSAFDATQAR